MTIHDDARAASEKVYDDTLAAATSQLEQRTTELRAAEATAGAAQAEVDRLNGLLTDALGNVAAVSADRDRIARALAESEDDLAEARARIAELEAGEDSDPEPVARPMLGACPLTGGMSASGVANVTARWGAGTAVRLFSGSGWTTPPALSDAGRLLLSWKPSLSTPINQAQCLAALSNLPAGTKVCVWHEPDVKVRGGDATASVYKARAREFYAIVKANRPDLVVMTVLSGWTFDPSTSFNPLDYFEPAACDVLCLDLDGLFGPKDYRPVVAEAQAWMRANGVTRWTVGEYGVKLAAGFTAEDRVKWLREQTNALLALDWPPEEVCLFEVDTIAARAYVLTTPAEQEAWRDLIGG